MKKEFLAIVKTFRWWVVPLFFVFFALLGAPIAKFTPELLKSAMPPGMAVKIPEPVLLDALAQWTKNLAQIGVIAVILFSMGLVSGERASNTIQLVLTKPVSRASFVAAKLIAQISLILGSILIAAPLAYLYALVLFSGNKAAVFAQANVLFMVHYFMIISITLAFSTILVNQIGAGGSALAVFAVLTVLPVFGHGLERYSPGVLPGIADKLLAGKVAFSAAYWPMGSALMLAVVMLAAAIAVFERQELY